MRKKTVYSSCMPSLVFIIAGALFFSLCLPTVSAVTKASYEVGDNVYVSLEGLSHVIIKVASPTDTTEFDVDTEGFSFTFTESGIHVFTIKSLEETRRMEFVVREGTGDVDESEHDNNSVEEDIIDGGQGSDSFVETGFTDTVFDAQIRVGVSVKQIRSIQVSEEQTLTVPLHKSAEDIRVFDDTGAELSHSFKQSFIQRFLDFFSPSHERSLVIKDAFGDVTIEYYTQGPTLEETIISDVEKKVTISSDDGLHYKDVLANVSISEELGIQGAHNLLVYWEEEDRSLDFEALDVNGNGVIDTVSWMVPHLSNQNFRIIVIVKAHHLDENREFIADIYENVSQKDDVWQFIPEGHFVRVTFAEMLAPFNDITLFAQSAHTEPVSVEVYEKDSSVLLATFENIFDEGFYKILLTSLEERQNVFDLRILGDIFIDLIIDPTNDVQSFAQIYQTNILQDADTEISVQFNNETYVGSNFSHPTNTNLQFEETGWYKVSYACIIEEEGDGGGARMEMTSWLELDGAEVIPSRTYTALRDTEPSRNRATVSGVTLVNITADSNITLQMVSLAGAEEPDPEESCWIYAERVHRPSVLIRETSNYDNNLNTSVDFNQDFNEIIYEDTGNFTVDLTNNWITVDETGWYKIYYVASSEQTSGTSNNDRITVSSYLYKNDTEALLPSQTYSYHKRSDQLAYSTEEGYTIANLNAGENISLRRLATEIQQASAITDTLNDTWLLIERLPNDNVLLIWDTTGGQGQTSATADVESAAANITWDSQVQVGSYYSHTAGQANFTINEDGWFEISYAVSWDGSTGTDRKTSCATLIRDGSVVEPSHLCEYLRDNTVEDNSVAGNFIVNNTAGSEYTLQQTVTPEIDGGGHDLIADSSWISVMTVKISNNVPQVATPHINSTDGTNVTTQDLNCVDVLIDDDNDTMDVSVRWYKNGVLNLTIDYNNSYVNGTSFNAVLGSGNTSALDLWNCSLRLYDGRGYSNWGNSTTLTVANTPPTHATPVLNSSSGTNGTLENLTVYNQSTSDVDSDSIKNIINWKENGTSLTLLHMPFEGGSNATWTRDYSHTANGSVSGATWSSSNGFDARGVYTFDGDDEIDLGDAFDLDEVTVLLWINGDGFSGDNSFIGKSGSFAFKSSGDELRITWPGVIDQTSSGASLSADTWTHVAFSYDRTAGSDQLKFYVDGVNFDNNTYSTAFTQNSNNVLIGNNQWNQYFEGELDDILVFNRSLTSAQIYQIYLNRTDLMLHDETSEGEVWQACVTPNDVSDDGIERCSDNLTIVTSAVDVTINAPVNSSTIADTTPLLNVTVSSTVDALWYNINDGSNVTICTSCSGTHTTFIHVNESNHTVTVYANNSGGTSLNSTTFAVNMSYNYFNTYTDNSSILLYTNVSWQTGNLSFTSANATNNLTAFDAYEQTGDSTWTASGRSDHSMRMVISNTSINRSGDQIRARFRSQDSSLRINYPTICERAGATSDCVDGTWQNLTINGSQTYLFSAGGQVEWSDWLDYDFNASRDYLLSFYLDASDDGVGYLLSVTGNCQYDVDNVDLSLTQNWSGSSPSFDTPFYSFDIIEPRSAPLLDGNITAYSINTSSPVYEITNVSWSESGTDATNNISVELSVDNGVTWYSATNNQGISIVSAGSALIYRVIFQSVLASPISLLDMNISWSSTPPTPPGVTVHFPTGTFPDVTPRLNVSVDTLAHTIWYNLDGGTNITLCTNCYSSSNVFLYVNETASTVNVYANNTGGTTLNSTSFTVDMNFNYFDTFLDNSSIKTFNEVTWGAGNVSYSGSSSSRYLTYTFENASDWTTSGGTWQITSNQLHQAGNENGTTAIYDLINVSAGADYNISMTAYDDDNDATGIIFRYRNSNNFYRCTANNDGAVEQTGTSIWRIQSGSPTILANTASAFTENTQNDYTVTVIDNNISCYRNGQYILSVIDSTWEEGQVGIYNGYHDEALYDNFTFDNITFTNNFTAYSINTSSPVYDITNVSWGESGIDSDNTISVELSVDNGVTWHTATNNQGITLSSSGSELLYRVLFTRNSTGTPTLLDMNISWSDTAPPLPNVSVHFPTGTFPDVTPRLNVSVDTLASAIWYNIDGGTNITLCTSCYSSSTVFLYVNETGSTVNVYANNSAGTSLNSTSFTVDMNYNYYDNFDDNSSIHIIGNATWQSGNISLVRPATITLLSDDFEDGDVTDGSPTTWTEVDNAASCSWSVVSGVLTESTNCNDGNRDGPAFGGYIYPGNRTWTDYNFTTQLRSTDNDGMGVMFRYQDDGNYYRVRFEGTNDYRRLERVENGAVTILDSDSLADGGLTEDTWFNLSVVVIDDLIEVYLDGTLILNASDSTFNDGTVALYSWGQDSGSLGSDFEDVRVVDLSDYDGSFYAYPINTSSPVVEIINVTWNESGVDAGNTITVQLSANGGGTWHPATNGQGILSITTGSSLVYRVFFSTNGTSDPTLLDMNITWSDVTSPAPNITINSPSGTVADVTPILNVTIDGPANELWYNVDGGTNITICSDCSAGEQTAVLYLAEGSFNINVFSDNLLGDEESASTSVTVDMNYNYFDTFIDNSSFIEYNGTTWQVGNITYTGAYSQRVLTETFEDTDNWTLSGGTWQITSNQLEQAGNVDGSTAIYDLINMTAGQDYNISMTAYDDDNDASGIVFRYLDSSNYYRCTANNDGGVEATGTTIWRIDSGTPTSLANDASSYTENTQNDYTVTVINNNISCYRNGQYILSVVDSTWEEGQVGMYNRYHQAALYDDFTVDMINPVSVGNVTAYNINTTNPVVEFLNITWNESGTNAHNNITLQISTDVGATWMNTTNGQGLSGFSASSSFIYRVIFTTNTSNTISLLDVNITWSDVATPVPNITLNSPINGTTIADVTPTLNVTIDGSANELWYNVNDGTNVTLCTSCTAGDYTVFLYLLEGDFTVNVFANNNLNQNKTNSTTFTIDMNNNYYDNFDDNSSIITYNDVVWDVGNISFTVANGTSTLLIEDFEDGNFSDGSPATWTEVDNAGSCSWTIVSGIMTESTNCNSGDRDTTAFGGYAYPGNRSWTDYNFTTRLRSSDDDGTGVMFRYQDDGNYYRVRFDGQNDYRRLERMQGGSVTVLDSDSLTDGGLTEDVWFNMSVVVINDSIEVYLNNTLILNATDGNFLNGTVAVYSWGQNAGSFGADFETVLVEDLSTSTTNFTAYNINVTDPIKQITNITWNEAGTDSENTIAVNVSVDGGVTWYNTTNGGTVTFPSSGSSLVYRVFFTTNRSHTISLLDMNISWSTPPEVTILYPVDAATYTTQVTQLNFSVVPGSGVSLDDCWWTNDSGVTNYTVNCNLNITTSSVEGVNVWTVFANDTDGATGSDTVNFTVDTLAPELVLINQTDENDLIITDTVPIEQGQNLTINVNVTDPNVDSVWLVIWENVKGGAIKTTIFFTYVSGFLWQAFVPVDFFYDNALYNYTIYANDTQNLTSELDGNFSLIKLNSTLSLDPNPNTGNQNVTLSGGLIISNGTTVPHHPINLFFNGSLLLLSNVTPVGSYDNYQNVTDTDSGDFNKGTYSNTTTDGENITLVTGATFGNYTRVIDAGARVQWNNIVWNHEGQACSTSRTWQEGDANSFAGTNDSYIDGDNAGTNYGSATNLLVDTNPNEKAIFQFDAIGFGGNKIPYNATINGANITVNVYDAGNPVTVYQILESWEEDEVTYNSRFTGTSWSSTGIEGAPSRSTVSESSFNPSATGFYTFDITEATRKWTNQSSSNYGIVLVAGGTNNVGIRSSEYSNQTERPTLTVDFSAPDCTGVQTYVRFSNDGTSWDSWQLVSNGSALNGPSVASRYLQYRLELSSLETNQAPNVTHVYVNYTALVTDGSGNYAYNFTTPSVFGTYPVVLNSTLRTMFTNASATMSIQTGVSPTVILVSPLNATWQNTSSFNLTYNASDPNLDIVNATLILNGAANQTNQTPIAHSALNNFTMTLADGTYNWTVNVTDAASNMVTNTTWIFYVDTQSPVVSLVSPPNNSAHGVNVLNLSFNATDNMDTNLTCDIYLDGSIIHNNVGALNATDVNFSSGTLVAGQHNWSVTCFDNGLLSHTSDVWFFNISDTPPNVTLIDPVQNYIDDDGNITFTYLPIDNSGFVNCSLYIDDIVFLGNQSDIVNGSNNTILRDNFTEGHYNWTVECVDLSLDTHRPTARNFTVDLNAMLIDLNAPANNTDFATSSVNVNFTATDSIDTSLSCNVTLNDDTVYSTVAAANGTLTNVLVTALPDGNTTWDVTCVDDAGHTNTSETRIIDVAEPPRIFLNSTNDSYFSSSTANLFYTPHDNSNVTSCDLYINDVFNQTNASIIALGAQNSFEVNGLVDGRYNWSVNCTDIVSTTNVSETRIFTVDSVDPTITLHYPDGHQVFAVNITFNFTVVDLYDDSLTCNLTVDSGIEAQNVAVLNNTVSNQTISGITDGYHTWFMNCSDNAGNVGNSLVYNFTRVTAPAVSLVSPDDLFWSNVSTLNLTYLPQDDEGFIASYLLFDGAINLTNASPVIANTNNNFTLTGYPDGRYNWSVNVTDVSGLNGSSSTRTFYIDTTIPSVTVNAPANNSLIVTNNVTFNFSVFDNLDSSISCNLTLDGGLEHSQAVTNNSDEVVYLLVVDGQHTWNVSCVDEAGNRNTTLVYNFSVEAPPNVTLVSPSNGTRTASTGFNLTYLPQDPIGISQCLLYVDNVLNQTENSPVPNVINNFTVSGLAYGAHNWTVNCTDPDGNYHMPSEFEFIVDTVAPNIDLVYPAHDTGIDFNIATIQFRYLPSDEFATLLTCNLTLDGSNLVTNALVSNGTVRIESVSRSNIGLGEHDWNVSCHDGLPNPNTSQTWSFNYTYPDFNVTFFSVNDTNPREGDTVLLNATVRNEEGSNATNVNISFWDGDPDVSGTYIDSVDANFTKFSSVNVSALWSGSLGTHNLFVVVDHPRPTNGTFNETIETNNHDNTSSYVGAWQVFYGFVAQETDLLLANAELSYISNWTFETFASGNIYAADTESDVSWLNLQAIGRDSGGSASSNDFAEVDSALSMTGFNDSVYNGYTTGGTPDNVDTYTVFSQTIPNVPIVNSTNNSNFQTGILWDTTDDVGDSEYDDTDKEDLIFVTKLNENALGAYGIYDYEFRVPALLREYNTSNILTVSFYIEVDG